MAKKTPFVIKTGSGGLMGQAARLQQLSNPGGNVGGSSRKGLIIIPPPTPEPPPEPPVDPFAGLKASPHDFGDIILPGENGTPLVLPGDAELFLQVFDPYIGTVGDIVVNFTNPVASVTIPGPLAAGTPTSLGNRTTNQVMNLLNDGNTDETVDIQILEDGEVIAIGIFEPA